MGPARCVAVPSARSTAGAYRSPSIDTGEWGAWGSADVRCLSTDVRGDSAASRNSKPNEVADTRMGADLLGLSVWVPFVKMNGGMLDTDGFRPARPSA